MQREKLNIYAWNTVDDEPAMSLSITRAEFESWLAEDR